MKNDTHIETKIQDYAIVQTVSQSIAGKTNVLWTHVIQTQDAQTREALIKLGWAPPAGRKISTSSTTQENEMQGTENTMNEREFSQAAVSGSMLGVTACAGVRDNGPIRIELNRQEGLIEELTAVIYTLYERIIPILSPSNPAPSSENIHKELDRGVLHRLLKERNDKIEAIVINMREVAERVAL